MWRAVWQLALAVALVGVTAACSSSSSSVRAAPAPTAGAPTIGTTLARPAIAWASLANPLLTDARHAITDPAIVFADGKWRALFSSVDEQGTWRIGIAESADLRQWSTPTTMPHDPAVAGEASPD